MDSGNKAKDLRKLTRLELYELAKKLNIKGRSTLSKEELIANIQKLGGPSGKEARPSGPAPTSTLLPSPRGKPSRKGTPGGEKEMKAEGQFRLPEVVEASGKPFPPLRTVEPSRPSDDRLSGELPLGYGDTRIVLQVRDPYWSHAYWEIADARKDELRRLLGDEGFKHSRFILRVYDVTNVQFDGQNANRFYDVPVFEGATNWYLNLGSPDCCYLIDLGLISPAGEFILIARSNMVRTPRDTFSEAVDEKWMVVDETFKEIYRLSGGLEVGASSGELRQALSKRLQQELSSGALSSGALSSLSSPVRLPSGREKGKDFWLVVNTELIVYGATEPDASLTVQGKAVPLRPDGTFSLRFALPDGQQEIPVLAVNIDGDMERKITPVVSRRTS